MTLLRRHLGAAFLAVLLCAAGLPLSAPPAAAAPGDSRVSDIRAWTNEIYTRVAIDTGEEVSWQANTLRADPARGLPPRIFIDIRGAGNLLGGEQSGHIREVGVELLEDLVFL